MSTTTIPDPAAPFNSYAAYIDNLLADRCDPAIADQVVTIVAALEAALQRQAHDDIDIELRLAVLEENVLRQLEALNRKIAQRPD